MATYVNDLRLKEIATGDSSGTWGSETNTNLELIAEALSFGTQDCFASDANATTTVADGATDPARSIYFKVTSSATLSTTRVLTIAPNTVSRLMFIENATTGSQIITIKQGSGATVNIGNGAVKAVYLDGAGSGAAVADALVDLDLTGTTTAAALTVSGVITGSTVEATGDTAAGDNAAIGYTAAEGLILTGQGSSTDVTVKNDADATVLSIATGTTQATFAGEVVAASLDISGDIDVDGTSNLDDVAIVGTATVTGTLKVKNGATNAGKIEFFEDSDNGTNKVTLIGPASTADITLTLPNSDGDDGQVLTTDGSGVLSFSTVGGAYNTWLVKTSAYTALVGDQIIVNSSSAVTITLPASASAGNTVIVKATGGGTVTLGRNSQKINSTAADGTLLSGSSTQLVFVDASIGFLEI